MSNVIPSRPGMTFEQREGTIGMLTAGMSARDSKSTTKQISANLERCGPTQIRQTA